jgi:hypothetical protein
MADDGAPIRISRNPGGMMWHVDYGDGTEQNFPSLEEAQEAARRIAESEGRDIVIEE